MTAKLRNILLVLGLIVCLVTDSSLQAKGQDNQNPTQVSFCDLLSKPNAYHQKLITTEAIVVVNFKPVVDGGETFLYSQHCNEKDYLVLSDFYPADSPKTSIDLTFKRIFSNAEKKKIPGRAKILITGTFYQAPENGGFGHLDGAKFKLETQKIEKVVSVPTNTPWPSWWNKKPKS